MLCGNCGTPGLPGAKFCLECGAAVSAACAHCATPLPAGAKFCPGCGAAVGPGQLIVADTLPAPTAATPAPVAERRLVSVLFADLVGFTTSSESRDAEETRDLLSAYFEQAREIIERYGGTV